MDARKKPFAKKVRDRIIVALKQGNYRSAACRFGGINPETLRLWLRRGERDEAEGRRTKYVRFLQRVIDAESTAEVTMVAQWKSAMPQDWRAVRDFLARRWPDRWAQKSELRAEITGANGGPVKQELDFAAIARDPAKFEALKVLSGYDEALAEASIPRGNNGNGGNGNGNGNGNGSNGKRW